MNARGSAGMLNRAINSLAFHSLPKQSQVIRRPRRRRRSRRHGRRKRNLELLERGRVEGLEDDTRGMGDRSRGWVRSLISL